MHTIAVGPRLKAEPAIRHLSDGDVWQVAGFQITVYNLDGSAMPVEGVGVGTGEPGSLSYADPDALAETTGVRNPPFPLSLAPPGPHHAGNLSRHACPIGRPTRSLNARSLNAAGSKTGLLLSSTSSRSHRSSYGAKIGRYTRD